MFSTPSIRPFSQENSGSVAARKPGTAHEVSRQPFVDRSVNLRTPNTIKNLASKQHLVKDNSLKPNTPNGQFKCFEDPSQLIRIGDDLINEYFSSHIDSKSDSEDTFVDICSESDRFTEFNSFNLLKAYCGYKSSSPLFIPLSTEEFEPMDENNSLDDSGLFVELEMSSCDDVSIPDLSLDED